VLSAASKARQHSIRHDKSQRKKSTYYNRNSQRKSIERPETDDEQSTSSIFPVPAAMLDGGDVCRVAQEQQPLVDNDTCCDCTAPIEASSVVVATPQPITGQNDDESCYVDVVSLTEASKCATTSLERVNQCPQTDDAVTH